MKVFIVFIDRFGFSDDITDVPTGIRFDEFQGIYMSYDQAHIYGMIQEFDSNDDTLYGYGHGNDYENINKYWKMYDDIKEFKSFDNLDWKIKDWENVRNAIYNTFNKYDQSSLCKYFIKEYDII